MTQNLLHPPERGAIETVLKKSSADFVQAPTFETILGFLSGAAITPGGGMCMDYLQPLFQLNGVVVHDVEDIELMTGSLTSLYDRLEELWLRKEGLFPFDMDAVEVVEESQILLDWATGLHRAVMFQEDLWIPYEDEVDYIDDKLKREVNLNIQSLTTVVDPSSIPDIVKDPVPFQRNVVSHFPDWREDMLRETWDDQLLELFRAFGLFRLDQIMDSLQRYARAYDEGDVVVIDCARKEGES